MTSIRRAVIVGVNDYTVSGISPLTCCVNDAIAMRDALLTYCMFDKENIKLFANEEGEKPTYSGILSAVEEMCSTSTPEDLIVFFFAGHGTATEEDSFLLTDEFKANILEDSSIPMKKLDDYFSRSNAKFKLRIYDACQSGRFKERAPGLRNARAEDLVRTTAEGWANLASCKSDEYAVELADLRHGLFTYQIVKGISGEAAVDNIVTLDSLKEYAMSKTIDAANKIGAKQTPLFSGEQAGSLIIARDMQRLSKTPDGEKLVQIIEHNLEADLPNHDKLDEILGRLRSYINEPHNLSSLIISSSSVRDRVLNNLLERVSSKLSPFVERIASGMGDKVSVLVETSYIASIPGQEFVARAINSSSMKPILDFGLNFRVESLEMPGMDLRSGLGKRKVAESLSGHSKALIMTIKAQDRTLPWAALTIAPLPLKAGLGIIVYFTASSISDIDTEELSNTQGIMKYIGIVEPGAEIDAIPDFGDLIAEFASFYEQQIQNRSTLLNNVFGSSMN